ncbi:MAG: hypothetical protein IKO62_07150 [Bacteroidales bacterium]|nr:hypothetical protein [Bacteroidales bacterium]
METLSTESNLTTSKESIRKDIRHALSTKGVNKYPNLDLSDDFLQPSDDLVRDFVVRFRALGGKYVPCTKEQFVGRLVKLLQVQNYPVLLNTKPQFVNVLKNNNINFVDAIDVNTPADAAIVFSDALIAQSCSFVFSPHNSLYPSVKGIASDLIIVALANNIVPDIKTALALQQDRNEGNLYEFNEIICPTPLTIRDNQEIRTPLTPRYILMLVL